MKRLPLLPFFILLLNTALPAETSEEISEAEQRQLALRFAPVLIFHPEEKYLPVSPEVWREQTGSETLSGFSYENASFEERARNAVVYYHVFDLDEKRIVEYWLYYVNDTYKAGGGLFPFWSDASHFNDMEFIFLILDRIPGDDWRVEKIISGAHRINNIHRMEQDNSSGRLRFLVELGAHAMAPDLDADGRFTPSVEGRSGSKIVWGIRDHGSIWARYSQSYSATRTASSAIWLYPGESGDPIPSPSRRYSYRLESVNRITDSYDEWKNRLPRNSRSWIARIFGKPDGSSKSLVIPANHPNYGNPGRAEQNRAALERGLYVGYTPILYDYTFLAGYRYTQPSYSRYVPDLVFDANALLCGDGNDYYEFQVNGSYPVDAISSLFGGFSVLGDAIDFNDYQLNWMGGLEVKLNRFRFRTAFRGTDKVSSAWLDFRLLWFF